MSNLDNLFNQIKPFEENLPILDNQNMGTHSELKGIIKKDYQIPINPLKVIFRKNRIGYKLLMRNQKVALFALSTDNHWEVVKIYILPSGERFGRAFPPQEVFSNDTQFGKDGSLVFQDYEKAVSYFNKLTKGLGYCGTLIDFSHSNDKTKDCIDGIEIVSPTQKLPLRQTKKEPVVNLTETFKKNSLLFKQIERSENVVLNEQYMDNQLCGFEVVVITTLPAFTNPSGKQFPSREAITINDDFGSDGSKAFFAGELERARKYFKDLNEEIESIKNGTGNHFYTPNRSEIYDYNQE